MNSWQQILRTNIRSLPELCDLLELQPAQCEQLKNTKKFGLNIPLRLVKKMEKGNLLDPLFLQFVPQQKEQTKGVLCKKDPVEDKAFQKGPRLLIKYPGRALLLTTGVCAMHCRYCFRQHFDYKSQHGFEEELHYIAKDSSIKEVILSGGDPLSLSDNVLKALLTDIEKIAHIKRLRFHSRFLIGIPERIDKSFLALLEASALQIYFVLHINHEREFDEDVIKAVKKMQKLGITMLNQAVLLKGVNDSVAALEALIERCIDVGILPYYLHQLDRVEGAMHFEVERKKGQELIEELRVRTSGFGQFRYVQELPHRQSKTALL